MDGDSRFYRVADRGFIEYIVVGQHRSNWADWTASK